MLIVQKFVTMKSSFFVLELDVAKKTVKSDKKASVSARSFASVFAKRLFDLFEELCEMYPDISGHFYGSCSVSCPERAICMHALSCTLTALKPSPEARKQKKSMTKLVPSGFQPED